MFTYNEEEIQETVVSLIGNDIDDMEDSLLCHRAANIILQLSRDNEILLAGIKTEDDYPSPPMPVNSIMLNGEIVMVNQ